MQSGGATAVSIKATATPSKRGPAPQEDVGSSLGCLVETGARQASWLGMWQSRRWGDGRVSIPGSSGAQWVPVPFRTEKG